MNMNNEHKDLCKHNYENLRMKEANESEKPREKSRRECKNRKRKRRENLERKGSEQ